MIEYFVFFLILFPVFAEPIPDYDKPYSPIFTDKPVYTWTDKVKMTIVAPSWNTDSHLIDSIGGDSGHAINISTRENSLKQYRFTETGVDSGIFTAEIILTGFTHDADGDGNSDTTPRTSGTGPTSGYLQVDRDSAVTISFEFADGVVLSKSVPVTWNQATISFSEDVYLADQTAQIRVVDPDMNLNPEALDQLQITVSSDSDVAGIEISTIETSESSGVFVGNVQFSQTQSSSGNRLFAIPDNSIIAKYDDHTLPKPYTTSDILSVKTIAHLNSSVSSTQRITNSQISISDSFGNNLDTISKNNPVQIVGTVTNIQNFDQHFVYLFQIKDSTGTVVHVSWIMGQTTPNQKLDVSQSWTPQSSGDHTIETFVWQSLSNPIPLSDSRSLEIFVE